VGQEAITATLGNALTSNRIAPAYLFSGPRGTGKTSSARILARSLNCQNSDGPTPEPCGTCDLCRTIASGTALDVIEIDAASNTGVDNIRELIERSRFAPVQARWKVYVVDECHMLSTAAFNALLKTLEEPPPQVVFVLATTDPQRVLPTILSRCQRFDFRRIPLDALEQHLTWIAKEESIAIQPEAIHVVAQRSQGGLRDAESLLDQLSLLPPPIEANAVWDLLGAVPEQELLALAQAMTTSEPVALLEATRNLLDRGRDPGAVLQGLAGVLRDLVLMAAAPNRPELTGVSPQFRDQLPELAKSIGRSRLLQWQAQLRGAEQQLRQSVQPRLWLEVLLLGLLAEPMSPAISTAPRTPQSTPAPAASIPVTAAAPTPTASTPAASPSAAPSPSPAQVKPPELPTVAVATPTPTMSGTNLPELWQQILGSLELPSTRMLLSQQAQLVRLDANRAVVQVAGNWMGMVQSRSSLLEQAVAKALGGSRQLIIEASTGVVATPSAPPAPVVQATPTAPAPVETESLQLPTTAVVSAVVDAPTTPQPTPLAANPLAPSQPTQPEPVQIQPSSSVIPPASAQNPANASTPSGLDRQAKNLADFFNGQVLDVDSDGIS
jgi:DNA polymerase-3 subunit gamma/tau